MSEGKDRALERRRLQNKRAVVTGAAQGIGLACAQRFLTEGANVVIADIDEVAGRKAAANDEKRCLFVKCDVSRREEIERSILTCVEAWGGIDILVNNAGIAPKGDIRTTTEALFDQVLSVNLKSAFNATQIAAERMIEANKGGVIINMSSVNAQLNIPSILAYNVSKGGLNQLTRNCAIALAPHRIRVCGIGPGTVMTDLVRNGFWHDEEVRRSILSRTPIGRAAEPEEIAAIAAFLASDDASYITGETIYADGGRLGLNYTVAVEPQ